MTVSWPLLRRAVPVIVLAGAVGIGAPTYAAFASPGVGQPVGQGYAHGQAALDRLGSRLPSVARAHGLSGANLGKLLEEDRTLAVDDAGGLAYFDVAEPGLAAAPKGASTAGRKPAPSPTPTTTTSTPSPTTTTTSPSPSPTTTTTSPSPSPTTTTTSASPSPTTTTTSASPSPTTTTSTPSPTTTTTSASPSPTPTPPPTTGPEFQLESLPGAAKTIYLDFDGHVTEGTSWNTAYGVTSIVSPAYDTDGNPSAFSATELANITNAWKVVAEDYAPFNVNVTTKYPGLEALRKYGTGDTTWGIRIVVTADTFANCGCGGHAYVGSFDDTKDTPGFVYNKSARGVAEAVSHEAGHTLNLAHDGTLAGATYYSGHGTGETSWAPIMGSSYTKSVTQWSQQEYYNANNTGSTANYGNGADDLAVIASMTNGNNFGYRADDYGDTPATATTLSGPSVTVTGRITTRSDVDTFSVRSAGAVLSVTAAPVATPNGDLDLAMTIRDAAGAVVATIDSATSRTASWSGVLPAGVYTVTLDGVGVGDPSSATPTGYTDYASIGQYTLSVTGGA